ncbi:MAG: MBL fold metallo-hydrolase [Candidatus Promineifilaceae bacterium]
MKVFTVDTIDLVFGGYKNTIASYLVKSDQGLLLSDQGLLLIETGSQSVVKNTVTGLAKLGIQPTDIKHVFVTHIHLDHAGAAGWWASQGAQIYVHPRGAKHLVDPSRLIQSATMVYGDALESLFGISLPVPPEQVTTLEDNEQITIGDICITAWDTQGHAKHHNCYVIDDCVFTGDSAGSRIPGNRFINLTSAPPQFDPTAFDITIDRLLAGNFSKLYLGHYGEVTDVEDHLNRFREIVWGSAELVRAHLRNGLDDASIVQAYIEYSQQRAMLDGVSAEMMDVYETANGFKMSGEGILLYWKRKLSGK